LSSHQAKQLLASHYQDIHTILSTHFQQTIIQNEFHFFLDEYHLPINSDIDEVLYIETLSPKDKISGTILGVYGAIILIKNAKDLLIALNTKSLLGYSIEVSNSVENIPTSVLKYRRIWINDRDMQSGLF